MGFALPGDACTCLSYLWLICLIQCLHCVGVGYCCVTFHQLLAPVSCGRMCVSALCATFSVHLWMPTRLCPQLAGVSPRVWLVELARRSPLVSCSVDRPCCQGSLDFRLPVFGSPSAWSACDWWSCFFCLASALVLV